MAQKVNLRAPPRVVEGARVERAGYNGLGGRRWLMNLGEAEAPTGDRLPRAVLAALLDLEQELVVGRLYHRLLEEVQRVVIVVADRRH